MSEPSRLPAQIGRYQVIQPIGQGAMGRVLLAHDPVLDRDVAIKVLRDDLGLPPEHREALIVRMRQEARASARVNHPNIVELYDLGEYDEVGLYLVFELVDGPTLKDRLTRGPLGAEAVAALGRELGGALTAAHEKGVLHRDVKPENVMLTPFGAKITDFGIARMPDSTLTRDGGLLGTPAYSAPESVSSGRFSPASDQFSLAATLWEALSGRRAFPGEDAVAVASRIATEDPPKIAEICGVDAHVDRVFARALSKNESSRFPSADDFGRALAEALAQPRRTAMPTVPDAHHRGEPRRMGWGWLVAGSVLGGGAVLGATRTTATEAAPPPPTATLEAAPSASASASASTPKPRRATSTSSVAMPSASAPHHVEATDAGPAPAAASNNAAPAALDASGPQTEERDL